MNNILLIEPDYKNTYPPLGLMKISYFHKNILGDNVHFCKGTSEEGLDKIKWDRIYVTTLFTFEWAKTIEAIDFAKSLVKDVNCIFVGGIAATMMPKDFEKATGIKPVCGLLDQPGKLQLNGDETIDQLIPDYTILKDTNYNYRYSNAYLMSATKGCGNKCGFCAVQKLEPTYVEYINIAEKIARIEKEFGPKKDLLLMDNNVLRSNRFKDIIEDIIAAGFGKGAVYKDPVTKKNVKRYVDFNQGLDAMFLTEEKAELLGKIALKPARIAFDHIEDKVKYLEVLELCVKHGISDLSNYILYNSENFSGKGNKYAADRPEDLYERMRITLDFKDKVNEKENGNVSVFSFPMRYIPLGAHERGYVGSNWNPKFLRAVQCMLIPTQGKGVGKRSFFEADFGKTKEEFVKFLCMPEDILSTRGDSEKSKSDSKRTDEEKEIRFNSNQKGLLYRKEWERLYNAIGGNTKEFIDAIGDNSFLPEKFLRIDNDNVKLIYLHYLTTPRLLSLLGLINNQYDIKLVKNYLLNNFNEMYFKILMVILESRQQPNYYLKNFISFFGVDGEKDLLKHIFDSQYYSEQLLKKWTKLGVETICIDFYLVLIYKKFVELRILGAKEQTRIENMILGSKLLDVAKALHRKEGDYKNAINDISSKLDTAESKKILSEMKKDLSYIENKMQLNLF